MEEIYIDQCDSPVGKLFIARTRRGLCNISFGFKSLDEFKLHMERRFEAEVRFRSSVFDPFKEELRSYFAGEELTFSASVEFLGGTEFERKVWSAISKIPYGRAITYKELALSVGSPLAYRAAGAACGKNPVPIVVPCHRVVGSRGWLGGYAGGPEMKRKLLAVEGYLSGA